MAWARLDDNFPDHPKVLTLSDSAFRLHVTAICYSARFDTDGDLSPQALRRIDARPKDIASLVNSQLWETADGKTYLIHDYLEYNPSREKREEKSTLRAEAGRLGGQRSGQTRRLKAEANASKQTRSKNEAIASSKNEPRPVPSRPLPPDETIVSSSPADTPLAVQEFRDTVLSKLPGNHQRDPLTWDEAESLARDYASRPAAMTELAVAIDDCRRERALPFPANLRKHLPQLPAKVINHPAANGSAPMQHDFGPAPEGYEDD